MSRQAELAALGRVSDTSALSNRNLIINGAMQVAQRGTSFTGVTHGTYTLDRWQLNEDSSAEFTITQSTETPSGFGSSVKLDVTTADTSLAAAHYIIFEQRIEGYNIQGFQSGNSNAKEHTVSFWVRANKTGTYICEMKYDTSGLEASQSYTIDAADTWEKKTLTFPAQTTNAPNYDNSAELRVSFWLSAGSNYAGGSALGTTWETTENVRAVGQVNLADSTSNEWYVTGVQLEVGDTATEFEHRSYGDELARCQRYYFKVASSNSYYGTGYSSTNVMVLIGLPTTMRTTPTVSYSSIGGGGSFASDYSTPDRIQIYLTDTSSTASLTNAEADAEL